MSSNLKLALDEYDAHQRRQQALVEAQRIGNLIHIQEQQLVAARHLAKQRKAARRQQHLVQQQQLREQQQQLLLAQSSIVAQPALDTLAESVFEEDEEDSSSSASRTKAVASRRAARKAKVASQASKLAPQHAHSEETARAEVGSPAPITRRYASHRRRPQEPNAVLAPRSTWKPDSHTTNCDNILCRKQFTLLGEKRHHCRRCGNIFCSACLSHKEVLYDMRQSSWRIFPERLLASIFPSEPKQDSTVHSSSESMANKLSCSSPPSSPAMTALSSSFESGSSHASGDYFDTTASTTSSSRRSVSQPPRPKAKKPLFERRKVIWEKGTDEHIPTPVPENWRAHVLDSATEEPVCDDCHCILWGVDTPTDLFYQKKALMVEREEIAWAIWLQGLDKWDACLRKHGLTLKKPLEEREKARIALKERRGSSTSHTTASSVTSGCLAREDSGNDLDYAGRPMHTSIYAWPTAPDCIRFTTAALKPQHVPQIRDKEAPSIFGMHRSVPRYIPTPTLPTRVFTPEEVAYHEEKEIERIEEDRQKRYREAIEDFLGDAYAMSDLSDDFRRRIHFDKTSQPSIWESLQGELSKCALDVASRWRGDNYGGW